MTCMGGIFAFSFIFFRFYAKNQKERGPIFEQSVSTVETASLQSFLIGL